MVIENEKVVVVGVGMTQFVKPGTGATYDDLGAKAIAMALADAGLEFDKIQQAYTGFVFGDSCSGQRSVYKVGTTGIPIINVNNNCSTGSSALYAARQAIKSGEIECALAVGFEQMVPGALDEVFTDKPSPLHDFKKIVSSKFEGSEDIPMAIRIFAGAGFEYQEKYGAPNELFAKVRTKAASHALHNERAIFRKPLSIEEVLAGNNIFLNVTRLQCCPPTCGGAAAIVCSEAFARKHSLTRGVVIAGQALTTDTSAAFSGSLMSAAGSDMTVAAAKKVYEQAGVGPSDIDVVELHDCFTTNEVITYEGLGLCANGGAEKFVSDGDNTYGGRVVTNPSGGLLSKGHPLGATGLAQCFELVTQLRGDADKRQVEGAKIALAHNLGLGGACVVTAYAQH